MFYDGTGGYIGYQEAYEDPSGGVPTMTWQRVGGTITTPPGTATLTVRLYNHFASGWIAFDDVELRRVVGQ